MQVDEILDMVESKDISDDDKKMFKQAASKIFDNMRSRAGDDKKSELDGKRADIEKAFYNNMIKMVDGKL